MGHSTLVIGYYVLTRRVSYQELGGDYFDRHQDVEAQRARLIRKLELLGLKVTVEPVQAVAQPLNFHGRQK